RVAQTSQQEVLVHRPVILQRRSVGSLLNQGVEQYFTAKYDFKLLLRIRGRPPFHQVPSRIGRKLLSKFGGGKATNGTHASQKMKSPALHRTEDSNIGERFLESACDRCDHGRIPEREPLLQNPVRAQVLSDSAVELLRVEQTRPCRFHRRRRVDRDYVVLRGRALQVETSVIDHNVR